MLGGMRLQRRASPTSNAPWMWSCGEREKERIDKIKNEHEVIKKDYFNRIEKILESKMYGVFKKWVVKIEKLINFFN